MLLSLVSVGLVVAASPVFRISGRTLSTKESGLRFGGFPPLGAATDDEECGTLPRCTTQTDECIDFDNDESGCLGHTEAAVNLSSSIYGCVGDLPGNTCITSCSNTCAFEYECEYDAMMGKCTKDGSPVAITGYRFCDDSP